MIHWEKVLSAFPESQIYIVEEENQLLTSSSYLHTHPVVNEYTCTESKSKISNVVIVMKQDNTHR